MPRASESRTETAARELLAIRGWGLARPPRGDVLWKNEYHEYPFLTEALRSASKSKRGGAGYPDFIVVDRHDMRPLIVGETKARISDVDTATSEATGYAKAFLANDVNVLAVGIAGNAEDEVSVRVHKRHNGTWQPVSFHDEPIQWLPTREETNRLLLDPNLFSLDPEVPPADVLADKADEINRILRECRVKDERRPAVVAAFMLALWKTHGQIRSHHEYVLLDVNSACRRAFEEAGKHEIAESITVDAANEALARQAYRIIRTLRLLHVTTLTGAHDYLGQLYEHFFRFTGGNTIGQFFTPRHVTNFMADLAKVTEHDFVVDPTCGTGGFLIASLYRMIGNRSLTRQQVSALVSDHLWGFESEPITAALCVANMILRGDGTTGIVRGDCFVDDRYPINKATISLGNPPFPHKKSDEQPEKFFDRALDALKTRGLALMVLPASTLVRGGAKAAWRQTVLKKNALVGVIKLPDELFEPYATAYTNVVMIRKGTPHRANDPVFFARIENDGFRLKKTVRVEQEGEQLTETLEAFDNRRSKPGWYVWAPLDQSDWSPGAYIESAPAGDIELRGQIDAMLRSDAAMHATYAPQLLRFKGRLAAKELKPVAYQKATRNRAYSSDLGPGYLGHYFTIYYGQRALHSKEWLEPGDTPIISSSGEFNGCYGFFDYNDLIRPPFATVPSTGTLGMAFVQREPCGVTDDCLLLFPREGVPDVALYIAAAICRLERWRFSYGRKLTPARIAWFKMDLDESMLQWIRKRRHATERVSRSIVQSLGNGDDSEELFASLVAQWRRDRKRGMDVHDFVMHPAYQRIIGMGDRAIPLLLHEMQQKADHWFWALHSITGENPIGPKDEGNLKRMTAAWFDWAKAHGYSDVLD